MLKTGPEYVTADTSVSEVINNPAFAGFGRFIFPVKNRAHFDPDMKLSNIASLLPAHNFINTDSTVNVINYMLSEVKSGKKIFYDFYTDAQKHDPGKESTGLFFFRGKPRAPFAVICTGGGFSYIGSIHGSYPIALELGKKGYNAFAIEYRTGGEKAATEDLAAAISFIFSNAKSLEVDTSGYSVWGGSAGARMAANIGSYGAAKFGGDEIPRPAIMVIAYTGRFGFTPNDPPVFALVSEDDSLVHSMDQSVANLRSQNVEVEYRKYKNAKHGFGLGTGTDAEGWINNAVQFWEKHSGRIA